MGVNIAQLVLCKLPRMIEQYRVHMGGDRRKVGTRALGAMLGGLNFVLYDRWPSSMTYFNVGFASVKTT